MQRIQYAKLVPLFLLASVHLMSAFAAPDLRFLMNSPNPGNYIGITTTDLPSQPDLDPINTANQCYFLIYVGNNGTTATLANSFGIAWYVDGVLIHTTHNQAALPANLGGVQPHTAGGGNTGPFKAGSHLATVTLDYLNEVDESGVAGGETNNIKTRIFTVLATSGSDLAPYFSSSWSDRMVISTGPGNNTDATLITSTDTLYVDSFVANFGPVTTTSGFTTRLKLDGNVVSGSNRTYPTAIAYLSGAAASDVVVPGPLSPGQHTLTLEIDSASQVAEADESNNTYTRTFTVSAVTPVITSSLTANGNQGTPFNYQITATNYPTSFNTTGLPAGLSVSTSTGLISGTPTVIGSFNVNLAASNAGGTGNDTLALTIGASTISIAEAVDATHLTWVTGGTGNWFGQTATHHDGVDAARNSTIGHLETNYVETTVLGPGPISFWWKVSSETNFDFLTFYLDGVTNASAPRISGEVDWQQKSMTMTPGNHTLRRTYSKDGSVSRGSDAAWLDQVIFGLPAVSTTNDSGSGSLRQAIADLPAGTTIIFDPGLSGQTITLTSGQLLLNKSLTIDASALPGGITINGNNASRVFEIAAGTTVTMHSLTLSNGAADFGGAFVSSGTLSLVNCTLSGNSSAQGGAMQLFGGDCSMVNCTISANVSTGNGGAIDNSFGAGTLSLTHCTVFGNSAAGTGAGIANYLRTLTLTNSIVAGNTGGGGDIHNFVESTVIRSGANIVPSFGNEGANLGPAALTSPPLLAPLGNYGGPTLTMPPLPGSPAIDAGAATTFVTDQRGATRPTGPLPDLGAVEAFPFSTLPLVDTDGDGIDDRLEPAYPQLTVGVNDRALDSDGDGSPDGQELFNMTDPNNPNDSFRILSFTKVPGVVMAPVAQWVADDWTGGTANWVDRVGGRIATVAAAANSPVKTPGVFPDRGAAGASGLVFDGVDDYFAVAAAQNPIAGQNSVTIVAFFKTTQGASGADGAHWRYPGPLNAEAPFNPNDWGLTYDAAGNAQGFFNFAITPAPAVSLIDGQPHTMILTWQDPSVFPGEGVARLYVDGILAGSTVEPDGGDGIVTNDFVIGSEKEQLLRYFSGAIGELRFYDAIQDADAVHADLTGTPSAAFDVTFRTFPGLDYELDSSDTLSNFTTLPGSQVTATSSTQTLRVRLRPGRDFVRVRQGMGM